MKSSSSGRDAFTISAPVLHRIRALTHCSVDRATTNRTTEPAQRTEATENVTRFHSEGILGAHGAPREATRRRAAAATRARRSPLVHAVVWNREKTTTMTERMVISLGEMSHVSPCKPQRRRNRIYSGQRDLLPGETLSLRRAPGPCCSLHSEGELTAETWHLSLKFSLVDVLRGYTSNKISEA